MGRGLPVGLVVLLIGAPAALAVPADVRVSLDDRPGSYSRIGGGSDSSQEACATGRHAQHGPLGLAIDPTDPDVVLAVGGDRCFQIVEPAASAPNQGSHWGTLWRSADAGASWSAHLLPGYRGDDSPAAAASPIGGRCTGASALTTAFHRSGAAYVGWGCGSPETRDLTTVKALVSRLSDHGRRVDLTTQVLPTVTGGTGEYTADIPADIQVDNSGGPHDRSVYIGFTTFLAIGGVPSQVFQYTRVYRSTDGGRTFARTPLDLQPFSTFAPRLAVGPDGTLYVAYREFSAGGAAPNDTIKLVTSRDGGESFSAPVEVARLQPFDVYSFTGTEDPREVLQCGSGRFACPTGFNLPRFFTVPAIAADERGVHLLWSERLPSGQAKLFARHSTDGAAFGAARQLDSEASGHQWDPDLVSAGGALYAVFYDSRRDPSYAPGLPFGNTRDGRSSGPAADTFLATSADGGASWKEEQLTRTASNPGMETSDFARVPRTGTPAVAAGEGLVTAVWLDNRDIVSGPDPRRTGSAASRGFFGRAECAWAPGDLNATTYTAPTLADGCLSTGGMDSNVYGATRGQRLRVTVRPRRLRAGRRSRVRIRVLRVRVAGAGEVASPASGAVVSIGRRTGKTNEAGRAMVRLRPRKARRLRLRVAYPGAADIVRRLRVAKRRR